MLLIIFILLTTAAVQGIKVDLPSASSAKTLDQPKSRVIAVSNDGTVSIDAVPVSMAELESELRTSMASSPDLAVILRGDRAVQYDQIMQVLDLCSRSACPASAWPPPGRREARDGGRRINRSRRCSVIRAMARAGANNRRSPLAAFSLWSPQGWCCFSLTADRPPNGFGASERNEDDAGHPAAAPPPPPPEVKPVEKPPEPKPMPIDQPVTDTPPPANPGRTTDRR